LRAGSHHGPLALGVDAHGIDLSVAMIEQARRLFPGGSYQVGTCGN
jgi:hypothetical protein